MTNSLSSMHSVTAENSFAASVSNKTDFFIVSCPGTRLSESPRWAHGQLRWVDIPGQTLFILREFPGLDSPPERISLPDQIGILLPTSNPSIWLGLGRQGIWKLSDGVSPELLSASPFDSKTQRFNDGRADAKGRTWASTLVDSRTPGGHLYQIDTSRSIKPMVEGLIVGNGLAFSPDNTIMYLADTRARCIWRYPFHLETGQLGEREIFATYESGTERPDGAAVSEDGHYWVAVFEGGRVDRWDPQGQLVCSYPLPVRCPTMPCFAGKDRQWLSITSAGLDRPEEERKGTPAGDLIAFRVDVAGCQEPYASL